MKLADILSEVFSAKGLDDKSYYKDNEKKKKERPDRWEPMIFKNGLNDFGPMGIIKKKKK